ncbi:histidine kinase [Actinoplanes sp. NBC_00393]|uniref:histidine kinase n=1 Tax=Actinoplanes sp. NBC_00393 TaxID=2975953 RepID=UPI002E1F4402
MARWRIWLLPVLLAAAQFALWPGLPLTRGDTPDPVRLTAITAVTLLITAALGFRDRRPVAVLVTVTAALTLGGWIAPEQVFVVPADTLLVMSLADLIALFSVSVRCSRRVTALAVAGLTLWLTADTAIDGGDPWDVPAGAVTYVVVAAAGRLRHRWVADRSAAADRLAEAEQTRRNAADAERRRLARELHDVTAHHLTSIVVNASAAQFLGDQRPDLRAEALTFAARTGREALTDLRRLVAVLPAATGPTTPDAPTPSLADLADDFRQLGQTVLLEAPPNLPPAVAEVVHSIAREALTNTLRYAPGATVRVRLSPGPEGTELLVEDDGRLVDTTGSAADLGGGRGLAGMRERAEALGGTLHAGPGDDGGWRVHATLPAATSVPRDPGRLQRWLRSHVVLDVALVALTLLLPLSSVAAFADETAAVVGTADTAPQRAAIALVLLAVVAHAAPLLWRRRYPWTAFTAVMLTTWLGPLLPATEVVPAGSSWVFIFSAGADLVAVYTVAARAERPGLTWIAPLATLVTVPLALTVLIMLEPPADTDPAAGGPIMVATLLAFFSIFIGVLLALPVFGCWLAGRAARTRRQRRIDREEGAVLTTAAQAELRARDERARVAAGLHTAVLAHAARVPQAADQADLAGVLSASREALSAMRSLLDNLGPAKTADQQPTEPTAARAPTAPTARRAPAEPTAGRAPTEPTLPEPVPPGSAGNDQEVPSSQPG